MSEHDNTDQPIDSQASAAPVSGPVSDEREITDISAPQPTEAAPEAAPAVAAVAPAEQELSVGALAAALSEDPTDPTQPAVSPDREDANEYQPLTTSAQQVRLHPELPVYGKIPAYDYSVKSIVLPSLTIAAGEEMASRSKERSLAPNWLSALTRMAAAIDDGSGEAALQDPNSNWLQTNPEDGTFLGPRVSAVAQKEGEVEGDQAVLGFRSYMDMGAYASVPLYGSGLWLKIEDPGDLALQELMREQTAEKGRIGRDTFATSFGARMVFTLESYTKLILANVREQTAKDGVNLMEHILLTDFNPLIHGLACAVYNNGFDYHRPCTAQPESCNHIESEHLNVGRAIFYDWNKLSRDQRIHMKNRKNNNWSAEELIKYREQFTFMHGTKVPIVSKRKGRTFYVDLQVPTLAVAIQSGHDWINYISQFVLEALGTSADPVQRNVYMERVARTTAAQQHRHWVKSITYGNGAVMSRKEDLDNAFRDTISADPDLVAALEEAIAEFSVKCTVSVVGVPNFTCTNCHKVQMVSADGDPNKALVAPFDPVAVFSDLMFQRLDQYLVP